MIKEYTREAGLRNLERELASICRKLARRKAEGKKGPFKVEPKDVEKLLARPALWKTRRKRNSCPAWPWAWPGPPPAARC